jgi:hypothetical protein
MSYLNPYEWDSQFLEAVDKKQFKNFINTVKDFKLDYYLMRELSGSSVINYYFTEEQDTITYNLYQKFNVKENVILEYTFVDYLNGIDISDNNKILNVLDKETYFPILNEIKKSKKIKLDYSDNYLKSKDKSHKFDLDRFFQVNFLANYPTYVDKLPFTDNFILESGLKVTCFISMKTKKVTVICLNTKYHTAKQKKEFKIFLKNRKDFYGKLGFTTFFDNMGLIIPEHYLSTFSLDFFHILTVFMFDTLQNTYYFDIPQFFQSRYFELEPIQRKKTAKYISTLISSTYSNKKISMVDLFVREQLEVQLYSLDLPSSSSGKTRSTFFGIDFVSMEDPLKYKDKIGFKDKQQFQSKEKKSEGFIGSGMINISDEEFFQLHLKKLNPKNKKFKLNKNIHHIKVCPTDKIIHNSFDNLERDFVTKQMPMRLSEYGNEFYPESTDQYKQFISEVGVKGYWYRLIYRMYKLIEMWKFPENNLIVRWDDTRSNPGVINARKFIPLNLSKL